MNPDKLVHMANQIGQFFEAMPDADEARAGVALHLERFWAPALRRALLAHIDSRAAPALSSLVHDAVAEGRVRWGVGADKA